MKNHDPRPGPGRDYLGSSYGFSGDADTGESGGKRGFPDGMTRKAIQEEGIQYD